MKKTIGAMVLAATAMTGVMATPAEARGNRDHYGQSRDYNYGRYERSRYNDRYDNRRYNNRSYYNQRCDSGTGGTIIGAIAGGLLGNEVARRGDKTEGAIIGAAVGAIAGRAIDKSDDPCKRRYRR